MRKLALICVLFFTTVIGLGALAQPSVNIDADDPQLQWAGLEFQPIVTAQVNFLPHLAARATLQNFGNSHSKTSVVYGYFGPSFIPADWVTISPMLGLTNGWFKHQTPEGEHSAAGLTLSLLIECSFVHERLDISAQIDGYFGQAKDELDVYAFYRTTYHARPHLNVGLQAEQVNEYVILGPHIGASVSTPDERVTVAGELQYYLWPESGGEQPASHSLRLVVTLAVQK